MDINPIKLSDLNNQLFIHINPKSLSFYDLKPGYILKTKHGWNGKNMKNVYILFDTSYAKQIINHLFTLNIDSDLVILRADDEYTVPRIHYNGTLGYETHWPYYRNNTNLDVTDIWETGINISMFKNDQDILNFYIKYDIWNF